MSTPPRSVEVTLVHEWDKGQVRQVQDYLAGEEPLEIRVNGLPLTVTMRTPGHDLDLAAGFLLTEGLIQRRSQIAAMGYAESCKDTERGNIVEIALEAGISLELERTRRNFFAGSSCGICGKASIESVRVRGIPRPGAGMRVDPEILCRLPDLLRGAQPVFQRTGGLHAAGLFTVAGRLVEQREDVGRHNAVDKIVGWALGEDRIPLSDSILLVSGRGGFEIVQKAAVAGMPMVVSISAPSSLAVRLAREMGMTLVGFLRAERFVVYAGEERLEMASRPAVVEMRH